MRPMGGEPQLAAAHIEHREELLKATARSLARGMTIGTELRGPLSTGMLSPECPAGLRRQLCLRGHAASWFPSHTLDLLGRLLLAPPG